MEYIITFGNTNFAIKSERLLLEENINVAVMPLPSEIRDGCGICLRVAVSDIKDSERLLKDALIDFEVYEHETGVYRIKSKEVKNNEKA